MSVLLFSDACLMYVYKCLEKYCSVPKPSVQIADLWTPLTDFILIVRILNPSFPQQKEKRKAMRCTKKVGHTSTALLPDMV